jgi:hypothetical protein
MRKDKLPPAKLQKINDTQYGVLKPKRFFTHKEQTKIGLPLQHPFWACVCRHCSGFTRASTTQLTTYAKLSCGRPECEEAGQRAFIDQLQDKESWQRVRTSYWDMVQRVRNHDYKHVTIDPDWLGPGGIYAFFSDMDYPRRGETLDRINGLGHYTKSNCKWSDKKTQSRNRFNVTIYNINGEEWVLADIATVLGIARSTTGRRIAKLCRDHSLSPDDAATKLLAEGREPAQYAVAA